jgi:7-carboxy-7-deazaguanine synthase
MIINEVFRSIQGESTYSGLPCIFVRLTGCNLRCGYCDTKYAYTEGKKMDVNKVFWEIIKASKGINDIIEITGGEPLLQFKEINKLISELRGIFNFGDILIETNGSIDINKIKRGWFNFDNVIMIMDWKCPSSGMNKEMMESNLKKLRKEDELKFVISTNEDYNEMVRVLENYKPKCKIIVSTVWNKTKRTEIVEKILKDGLNVRFQLQIHKLIWDVNKRGV